MRTKSDALYLRLREAGALRQKAAPLYVKGIEDRTVKQIFAVMGNVDDGGERIHPGAFAKTILEDVDRVRVLWQHDRWEPPIGVPLVVKELPREDLPAELLVDEPDATGALYAEIKYIDTPRGNEVLVGIREKAIRENSFMYDEVTASETVMGEEKVRELIELRLWDLSPVNWGMNPATLNLKAALPYRDTGVASEDLAWSAPGLADFTEAVWDDLADTERRRIAAHFAWAEAMPPASFGQLKLPHHTAGKSGVGPAVWRACAAAMGALMGGRGGVSVPDGDRRGIYDHLVGHYKQFEKTPPDFKMLEAVHQHYIACATFASIDLDPAKGAANVAYDAAMRAMNETQTKLEALMPADGPRPASPAHPSLTLESLKLQAQSTRTRIALHAK
jgi:HK97 family phage prohead protease